MLSLKSETELIKLGENPDALYILLEGDLTVNVDGQTIALKPGEPVGEMSLLTGLGASASVYVPEGKSAMVAMVLAEDILTQYAAEDLYADLVNVARSRKGLLASDQN
jgi:CRP-like cAMP-binding protein